MSPCLSLVSQGIMGRRTQRDRGQIGSASSGCFVSFHLNPCLPSAIAPAFLSVSLPLFYPPSYPKILLSFFPPTVSNLNKQCCSLFSLTCRLGPNAAGYVEGILMAGGGGLDTSRTQASGRWTIGKKRKQAYLIQTAKSLSVKLAPILNRYKITRLILCYFHNNFSIHEAYSAPLRNAKFVVYPSLFDGVLFIYLFSSLQISGRRIFQALPSPSSARICGAISPD